MSLEAALAFRDKVNASEELQRIVRDARDAFNENGQKFELLALAREHGCEFTREEFNAVYGKVNDDGELSDFELELVSAGGSTPCTLGVDCPEDCGSGG